MRCCTSLKKTKKIQNLDKGVELVGGGFLINATGLLRLVYKTYNKSKDFFPQAEALVTSLEQQVLATSHVQ